ncbi:PTS system mannose/fructose/sorbose family transporter subunit IID [Lactobacillus sp. ESL0679]|uniref:PTS system mannose/fructose/sorbose family transporter subunit IID n=1 Tax=unclassified Lactobacillus TaxID=2620435 RepID=UPI0023F6CF7F|nr:MULTISPECIES: PTS system mannose/fructose/sorbose family transporter subunit IID [unclassified Lactobacillus]MDF7682986.1 PTS system mannose/fructose/sorbose family transporter subunit IID [Lactobacillus sp. ESL0679]WEV37232.1 PTS system mannose/fructose/sorbose family transporter subunit IID [Lactobacillus sp. ESL0677]
MNKKTLTKKDLHSIFWRAFALQGGFNYEKMQNIGYAYAMEPAIKRLYSSAKDRAAALKRHLALFNCTPAMTPTILGISCAMEEQYANNPDEINPDSINSVKASLMAPFSGIGDSILFGTFRVIAAGVGVSFSKQGNILGPILFFVLYNLPATLLRVFGLKYGYEWGVESLDKVQKNGVMDQIMQIVGIVGMMVVGGMVATMLPVTTPLKFAMSGATIKIQSILDKIIPEMLPLLATLLVFWLIRKKVSTSKLTISVLILGILLHVIGIL